MVGQAGWVGQLMMVWPPQITGLKVTWHTGICVTHTGEWVIHNGVCVTHTWFTTVGKHTGVCVAQTSGVDGAHDSVCVGQINGELGAHAGVCVGQSTITCVAQCAGVVGTHAGVWVGQTAGISEGWQPGMVMPWGCAAGAAAAANCCTMGPSRNFAFVLSAPVLWVSIASFFIHTKLPPSGELSAGWSWV